jgi:hypothetical protein
MARVSKSPTPGETSSPTPADTSLTARPRPRRRIIAVASVVGTAVVAALAAAVITPERIDAFVHLFSPSSAPSSLPEIAYKRVVSPDGVFTLDVPESWLSSSAVYNVTYAGIGDVGAGMSAGVDPTDGRQPTEDGIYLGASVDAANRLHLDAADASAVQAWADEAATEIDWSQDGCVRGVSQLSGPDGWATGVTPWVDCYSTTGLRIWEMYAVPPSRDFTLCLQLQLSQGTDEAVLEHIIGSLVVDESRIPTKGEPEP